VQVLIGWRGAGLLIAVFAITMALPVVFGPGSRTRWDWGAEFVTFVFVILPVLCLIHVALTVLQARALRGRARLVELTSLVVPFGYGALGYFMDSVIKVLSMWDAR
jgi:hypothetical protein